MFSKEEIKRYDRHLLLDEIGVAGQEKLKGAKVLVVGAGGLGCPVLQYLTAAGVGRIGIVDFDTVDESNLQRQVLYTIDDIEKAKVTCAIAVLSRQNPFVEFVAHQVQLNNQNATAIIEAYDIVVDGTDNFPTRYLVNDVCVALNKVLVYGSINKFEGQVSVFNMESEKGERGPTYRCLFPNPPAAEDVPSCSEAGVLGVLPGIVGALQANEAIKIITGAGEVLSGKLYIINALSMQTYTVDFDRSLKKSDELSVENIMNNDYDYFCNGELSTIENEITADELYSLIENERGTIQLVDVRDEDEQPIVDELIELSIPLAEIIESVDQIDTQKKVVVFCRTGSRSLQAIAQLQSETELKNLYNLKGGVVAWLNND